MARYKYGRKKRPITPRSPLKTPNRPAKRRQWTNEQMTAAIDAYIHGSSPSINQAARDHAVPPSTLKDRLSGRVLHGSNPGPSPYLSAEEEHELELYLIQCSKLGYGKTRRQVISIVKNVAKEKGILRPSSYVRDGWWRRFLQRHPAVSLRAGDATGHVRMNAITHENLQHYFDLLKDCLTKYDFAKYPERIYNMDESGVPLDPKPPKVVSAKGQRKIRYRCSGNKGQITVLGCSSATGQMQPPFIDAAKLNPLWTRGEIPGTRSSTPQSALAKHLQPVSFFQTGPKKTGKARVLTSSDCLEMLEEKRKKKELEQAEKENRKKAKEEEKKEKDLLLRKKKEEQERKKVAREKKKEEQELQRIEREKKKADKGKKKATPARQQASRDRQQRLSTSIPDNGEASTSSAQLGSSSGDPDAGESEECSFCFQPFTCDGLQWVQCACARWVHESCLEDIFLDDNGKERFCPFCIN